MQGGRLASKNRKFYLSGKMSLREFFSAPTRYLAESISKESEFEKPYLDEDYRKMHLDMPWPDWPPFPPLGPLPDIPGGPVPGLTLCGIVCYAPLNCDEPIWCHPGIWCGYDPLCDLCSWTVTGATTGFSPHPFGGSVHSSWGIDIWIDSTLAGEGGEALIHVQMKDSCNNLCGEDIEVTCDVCPADVAMTWASGDLTVGQSSSVAVEVVDGLGPYSWSVSGTGFSMLHASTEGVGNTLVTAADACGSATITVTDFCDTVVTGYVRCTTGQWTLKEDCRSCFSGAVWTSACATCGVQEEEIISGYQRWLVSQRYEYYPDTLSSFWGQVGCGSACVNVPPCGTPIGCGDGTICTGSYNCFAPISRYYEWECVPP